MRGRPIAGARGTARFQERRARSRAPLRDGVPAVTAPGISFSSLLFLASFVGLFVALALID
jgi:hypothetical protein